MEVLRWLGNNWFELVQLFFGGGVIYAAYTVRRDTRGRRITNLIAINGQRQEAWKPFWVHPELERVLEKQVDLRKQPISSKEDLFVTNLILNLSVSFRAMKYGELITFEGLQKDVAGFLPLPIPKRVWETIKHYQDKDFVEFIKSCLGQRIITSDRTSLFRERQITPLAYIQSLMAKTFHSGHSLRIEFKIRKEAE